MAFLYTSDYSQQCKVADVMKQQLTELIAKVDSHAKSVGADKINVTKISDASRAAYKKLYGEGKLGLTQDDILLKTLKLIGDAEETMARAGREYQTKVEDTVLKELHRWIKDEYKELDCERTLLMKLYFDLEMANSSSKTSETEKEMAKNLLNLHSRQMKRVLDLLSKIPNVHGVHTLSLGRLLEHARDMHLAQANAANKPFILLQLQTERDD